MLEHLCHTRQACPSTSEAGSGNPAERSIRENSTLVDILKRSNRRVAALDVRLLVQHVLDISHAQLVMHPERALTAEQQARFENLLDSRVNGEPVAYLVGEREFFGLNFEVTPDVLIPRPETELLVELGLARMPGEARCSVLDLGTGSGAIAITLAAHRRFAHILAVDSSEGALLVARRNLRRLLTITPQPILPPREGEPGEGRIAFVRSDWFSELGDQRFDLIVANPPYIAANDPHLDQGDVRFEPRSALVGGEDGLLCIRHIVAHAHEHLGPGGWLLLEHGYDQADACRELLQAGGYTDILCRRDLAGIRRVAGGRSCR